jgi:hypothetical protein
MPSRKWRPARLVQISNGCKVKPVIISSRNAWRIGTIRAAGRLLEPSPRPNNSAKIHREQRARIIGDWLQTEARYLA